MPSVSPPTQEINAASPFNCNVVADDLDEIRDQAYSLADLRIPPTARTAHQSSVGQRSDVDLMVSQNLPVTAAS